MNNRLIWSLPSAPGAASKAALWSLLLAVACGESSPSTPSALNPASGAGVPPTPPAVSPLPSTSIPGVEPQEDGLPTGGGGAGQSSTPSMPLPPPNPPTPAPLPTPDPIAPPAMDEAVPSAAGGMASTGGAGAAGSPGMVEQGGELGLGGVPPIVAPPTAAPMGGMAGEPPPPATPPPEPGACSLLQEGFSTVDGGTTGGEGGEVVTVSNQGDLERYAGASEPYVIRIDGKITVSPKGKEITVRSNKTLIGIGATAEIDQGGFRVDASNVIIRNLTLGNTFKEGDWNGKDQDWDGIQMDGADHIWIDHCDFHHIGDGILDSRRDTTNLTVSWNIMRDHNKAFGIGWTDNLTTEMTIHHNWIHDTSQRNPSTDNVLRAHLYNNFLHNIEQYGNWARGRTNMVLENSVFDAVKHPHILTNPDIDTAGGGTLIAIGNIVRPNCTGNTESSGEVYDFFDPHDFYEYHLDPAEGLEALLMKCSGPLAELGQE